MKAGIGAVFLNECTCLVGYIEQMDDMIYVYGIPCISRKKDLTVQEVEKIIKNRVLEQYIVEGDKPVFLAKGRCKT